MVFAVAFTTFISCQTPDEIIRNDKKDLARIWAALPGEKDQVIDPRFSTNGDTVYFDIPYFYPETSDNEVDLSTLVLRANIPTDARISPALGMKMDLTKPVEIKITAGTGEIRSYIAVARKVSDKSVKNIKIAYGEGDAVQETEGILKDNGDILFYVVPGTDVTKATLSFEINPHATSSIQSGTVLDMTNARPLTITGNDGVTKVYNLKKTDPETLDYGIGLTRKLWVKTAQQLGFTDYSETGLAVSGDYLVVVSSGWPSRYRLFNRLNGTYIRDIPLPAGVGNNASQVVNDSTGHLLAASYAGPGEDFYLYRYQSAVDATPEKLVEWTTPATATGGIGRRVNLYGDLNGNAVIQVTESITNKIYKWRIQGGKLASNEPEILIYPAVENWGYQAEAQPVSASENPDYFLNYSSDFLLVNGTTQQKIVGFASGAIGTYFHAPTEYFRFNNANYVAAVDFADWWELNRASIALFDVTDRGRISLPPSNAGFSNFKVFSSEVLRGSGTYNGNGTADVCVKMISPDKIQVYMLLTNSGIMAYELTRYAP